MTPAKFRCRVCDSPRLFSLLNICGIPSAAQAFYETHDSALNDVAADLKLCICEGCRVIQLANSPVSYFKRVITAASIGERTARSLWLEWEPLIDRYSLSKARILEVGAGRGDFVRLLKAWGLDAKGIEFDSGSENADIVYPGYFPDDKLNEKFDAIICNNFLEHHPAPREFLLSLYDHLNTGGFIYISVPRFEYLFERACFYELVPDHLSYFTSDSLATLLKLSGFDPVEAYTKNNDNDHVIIARRRELPDFSTQEIQFSRIVECLRSFFFEQRTKGLTVAAWGAGHRALSLLSLVGPGFVEVIIDSAPFKQGKFTPILGVEVVSPARYCQQPTDVLIIMVPGNFASQVQEFLSTLEAPPLTFLFKDSEIIDRVF